MTARHPPAFDREINGVRTSHRVIFSKRLAVKLDKRRVVPVAFGRRGNSHSPEAAAWNRGDGREAAVRTGGESRARDERPNAIDTLQDERIVVARVCIDVPADGPSRAIGCAGRPEQIVFAGSGVRGDLDRGRAGRASSNVVRIRSGIGLLLADQREGRRRRGESERQGRSGGVGRAGDNTPGLSVPVLDERLVRESGAGLLADGVHAVRRKRLDGVELIATSACVNVSTLSRTLTNWPGQSW